MYVLEIDTYMLLEFIYGVKKGGLLKVIALVNETLLSNELASPSSSGGLGAREGAKEE